MMSASVPSALHALRVPKLDSSAPLGESEFDPFTAALRFVDGAPTKDDIQWIGRGFAACLVDMGAVPLERCLRLPTTATKWRELRRDQSLCMAASLIDAEGSWAGAKMLESKWNQFIAIRWPMWGDDECPPDYATPLSVALFWATRTNRSQGLGAKQLHRITGHIFAAKCR